MALERFTNKEYLDGENKYKCPKENKMVKAVKRMTIERAPNVLVLQLKRFEFSRLGRKITKKVCYNIANWVKDFFTVHFGHCWHHIDVLNKPVKVFLVSLIWVSVFKGIS
jgi:ubiquitin C-terminal hydrolase